MKNLRISMLSLVLGLAAATTAAWGAESILNLISAGEALQKDVLANKAKADATDKQNKDLAVEGKELSSANAQLNADIAALNKDSGSILQRKQDYQTRCGPDKKLTQDQFKACSADKDQLNADIVKNAAQNGELKKRQDALFAKINTYNAAVKTNPADQKAAYDAYNASIKKEASWLDQARTQMTSDAFKTYGAKAGCPDVSKPTKTADAMIKLTDDILTCLKKVSSS